MSHASVFSHMFWILLVHLDLEIFNINMWQLWKWDFPPSKGLFLLLLVGCCCLLVLWLPRQFWWSLYYLLCEEICVPLTLGSPVVLTVFLSMFGRKRKDKKMALEVSYYQWSWGWYILGGQWEELSSTKYLLNIK